MASRKSPASSPKSRSPKSRSPKSRSPSRSPSPPLGKLVRKRSADLAELVLKDSEPKRCKQQGASETGATQDIANGSGSNGNAADAMAGTESTQVAVGASADQADQATNAAEVVDAAQIVGAVMHMQLRDAFIQANAGNGLNVDNAEKTDATMAGAEPLENPADKGKTTFQPSSPS